MSELDTVTTLPPPQPNTPKAIPLESIIELYQKGLSTRQIAKLLNCTHPNIVQRLKEYKREVLGIETFKKNRGDIFALFQSKIINKVTEDDYKKASLLQKTTAISQLYDKERLERGQSTSNLAVQSVATDLQSLLDRLQVEEDARKTIDITPDNDDPLPPQIEQSLGSE